MVSYFRFLHVYEHERIHTRFIGKINSSFLIKVFKILKISDCTVDFDKGFVLDFSFKIN